MADVEVKVKIEGVEYTADQLKNLGKTAGEAATGTKEFGGAQKQAGKETEGAGEKFKKVQRQIMETKVALQQAAAAGDKVKFQKLRAQLDELEEGLEKTQFQSQQFDDQLTALPGPIGNVGNSIKMVDGLFKMLAANPILAIITAIVGAFMLMKKSMESTAAGQKVLNKITEAFGKILGPIMLLIQKVAMPIFEGLAAVIEYVAEGFQKFASILGYGEKEIREASYGVEKVREETEKAEEARQKKAEERAKKEKERVEKEKEQRKKNAEDAKKRAEERKKLEEERIQNAKDVALKLETLRVQAIKDEAVRLAEEVRMQKEAAVEELKSKGATKEQIKQLEGYYDELSLTKVKEYNDKKLEEEKKAAEELAKQKEEEQKAADQKETERLAKLDEMDFTREQAKLETDTERKLAQIDREEAAALKELDLLKASEEDKLETIEYYAKLRDDVRQAEVDKALQTASQILGNISTLAGEGTAVAKAAGIAQATINTYLAASQALADPTIPTFLKPFLVATQIGLGMKQVAEITKTKPPKFAYGGMVGGYGHAGGGTLIEAEAGEMIINRNAMQTPGVAQLAGALNSISTPDRIGQMPALKTYVVATEVTSAQEANSKVEKLARL